MGEVNSPQAARRSPVLEFLSWINDDQSRYIAIAQSFLFAFAGLVVAGAFFPRLNAWLGTRRGGIAFLGFAFLVLLAARWPTFFAAHPLNPDEAQMVAQAITVPHDPVAWVGFDGLTSGPVNTYLLDLPALLGAHPSFLTTRIVTLFVLVAALGGLYVAAALCFDAGLARLAIVPPLVFWAISIQDDFVHYSSELASVALCSILVALLCWARWRDYAPRIVYALGFAGGMIPFAKLQAVPLEVSIALVAAIALAFAPRLDLRRKAQRFGIVAAGAATFPILLLAVVAAAGGLRDFWLSYILSSLAYILFDYEPLTFLTSTPEFGPYFDWLFVLAFAGGIVIAARFTTIPPAKRYTYLAALAILAGGIDSVFSPKRGSPHYLHFGVIPIAAAAAAGLAAITWLIAGERPAGRRRGALAIAFVATCLIVQNAVVRPPYNWIGMDFHAYRQGGPPDPTAAMIERNLRPGDRLAIWGWVPEYYVYTGTLLGTRDAVTGNQYTPYFNPYRDYYRKRYIDDLLRIRPAGFLDAGAESFDPGGGTKDDYKSFPELAAIVDRAYVQVGTWKRFRFFVRRDLTKNP